MSSVYNLAIARNSNPAAAFSTNRLEVFRVQDGAVWHIWQTETTEGSESNWWPDGWVPLVSGRGNDINQIAVGQNADGRLELFGFTSHGSPYHVWQTDPDNPTSWGSSWEDLAAPANIDGSGLTGVEKPELARYFLFPARAAGAGTGQNNDGRLELFATVKGTYSSTPTSSPPLAAHIWQDPDGLDGGIGGWSNWHILPSGDDPWLGSGPGAPCAAGQSFDGTFDSAVRLGVYGMIPVEIEGQTNYTMAWAATVGAQTAADDGWPDIWQVMLPPGVLVCDIGQNSDARLELFGLTLTDSWLGSPLPDGTVIHWWQDAAGDDTSWQGWNVLGLDPLIPPPPADAVQIAVGQNADGRLEVFTVSGQGSVHHCWQGSRGDSGSWTGWAELGSGHVAHNIVVGQNDDGRLEVVDFDGSATTYHIWQGPQDLYGGVGGWSNWTPLP